MPAKATPRTTAETQAKSLSKFIVCSFDDDSFGFKSSDDIHDRITVPFLCTSRRDVFSVQGLSHAIWIGAHGPKSVDQQEIFVFPRVGRDLALEVTEAVVGANIPFAYGPNGLADRRRHCRPH